MIESEEGLSGIVCHIEIVGARTDNLRVRGMMRFIAKMGATLALAHDQEFYSYISRWEEAQTKISLGMVVIAQQEMLGKVMPHA